MGNKNTKNVLELPSSCKSARERMEAAMELEDLELEELEKAQRERTEHTCTYKIAQLNEACQDKIKEFEHELNKQGTWNIALVAYQKDC